jgi:hypothetical protein
MPRRSYVWTGTELVERPLDEPTSYGERADAERALDARRAAQRERDAHPGNYV